MNKLIDCICGEKFPVKGEFTIGDHALVCPDILERKNKKKVKLADDKEKEMKLFKSTNPPCMCKSKYEETRDSFNILLNKKFISERIDKKVVYIDFPNFQTRFIWQIKKFFNMIVKLWTPKTEFKIYMKFMNKRHFIECMNKVKWPTPEIVKNITLYIVNSDKAPVSRDDILMLKHLTSSEGVAVIPLRDEGEKYRDLGYHVLGEHEDFCRALERYGGKKKFKWATYKIKVTDKYEYEKIQNCKCGVKDVVVSCFKSDIFFFKF